MCGAGCGGTILFRTSICLCRNSPYQPMDFPSRGSTGRYCNMPKRVSATALNDLADERIDKVNHPRDAGRPLVEGTATRRDLRILNVHAPNTGFARRFRER